MEESKKKKRNKKNKGKNISIDVQSDVPAAPSVSISESEGDLERFKLNESRFEVLEEMIKDARATVISCVEKEASLKNEIEVLQKETYSLGKKDISWNLKMEKLEIEVSCLSAKQASLDQRIESSIKNSEESADLQKTLGQMLSRMEEIESVLQRQVKEADATKISLAEENKVLSEKVSLLESRLRYLESAAAAASQPHSKGSTQNTMSTELSEVPLETQSSSSTIETKSIPLTHFEEITPDTSQPSDGLKEAPDIIQISLNGIRRDHDGQPQLPLTHEVKVNDRKPVPLTDAPLIGAPFRLISFVAKYVSGADLVHENRHDLST